MLLVAFRRPSDILLSKTSGKGRDRSSALHFRWALRDYQLRLACRNCQSSQKDLLQQTRRLPQLHIIDTEPTCILPKTMNASRKLDERDLSTSLIAYSMSWLGSSNSIGGGGSPWRASFGSCCRGSEAGGRSFLDVGYQSGRQEFMWYHWLRIPVEKSVLRRCAHRACRRSQGEVSWTGR